MFLHKCFHGPSMNKLFLEIEEDSVREGTHTHDLLVFLVRANVFLERANQPRRPFREHLRENDLPKSFREPSAAVLWCYRFCTQVMEIIVGWCADATTRLPAPKARVLTSGHSDLAAERRRLGKLCSNLVNALFTSKPVKARSLHQIKTTPSAYRAA